jgi:hypothetical protein
MSEYMDFCMMHYDDDVNKSLSPSSLCDELERRSLLSRRSGIQAFLIRTVDKLSMMVDDSLDRTLLLEVSDRDPSEATIDLESFDEDALRNESECWRFLEDTIIGGLIKGDGVLRLVFNLALGPLLLLGCFATG